MHVHSAWCAYVVCLCSCIINQPADRPTDRPTHQFTRQVINLIVGTVCGAHITACLFSYFARIDNDSFYSDSWVLK